VSAWVSGRLSMLVSGWLGEGTGQESGRITVRMGEWASVYASEGLARWSD
jgi:hypothetical protein